MDGEQTTVAAGVVVGGLMLAGAVAVAVVVWAAADGRLGPNPWAGLRTRQTMAGGREWQAAHRAALVPSVVGLAGMGLAGVLAFVLPTEPVILAAVLAGSGWAVGWLVVGLVRGQRAARQVAAER